MHLKQTKTTWSCYPRRACGRSGEHCPAARQPGHAPAARDIHLHQIHVATAHARCTAPSASARPPAPPSPSPPSAAGSGGAWLSDGCAAWQGVASCGGGPSSWERQRCWAAEEECVGQGRAGHSAVGGGVGCSAHNPHTLTPRFKPIPCLLLPACSVRGAAAQAEAAVPARLPPERRGEFRPPLHAVCCACCAPFVRVACAVHLVRGRVGGEG